MGSPSEPPRGWNPDTDSLQDLVHAMFQEQRSDADPSSRSAPEHPSAAVPDPPPPADRAPQGRALQWRPAALAAAALITAALAGGQIVAATNAPAPAADVTRAGPTAVPTPARASTAAATVPATPLPAPPVVVDFGRRADIGDGWRLAASNPYLCDVLMAIPVRQQDGTRIMRVTLTLTNRTGTAQPTRVWQLAATADAAPAELVLWPAERFRGVPDMTLTPGRSVGFLVAIRVPDRPVRLRLSAVRDAAPRAVLDGTL